MSDEASTELCAVCGKTDKEHTEPTLSGEKERRHFFEPPREASTGNEQGWRIAGHNGIVVDPAAGVVTDEYAKKNLRTVSIDLDRDGKYIEFAVTEGSAKELRDYLTDQAARIAELTAELENVEALRNLAWTQRFDAENQRDQQAARIRALEDELDTVRKSRGRAIEDGKRAGLHARALEAALTKAGELLEWAEMELRSLPSSGHEAIDRLTEQNIHRFLLDHAELTQTLFYSEARGRRQPDDLER